MGFWWVVYYVCLSSNCKVFDGGCGLGLWARYVAGRGFETVGWDISRETIRRLQASFPEAHFSCGDIRKTNFPENYFGLYYSWGVFEHFEEGPERCFTEAARIIEPGGYLLVSVPFQNIRHSRLMRKSLLDVDKYYKEGHGYEKNMRFYQWRLTQQELEQQMAMAGFDIIEIVPIEKREGIHRALLEKWSILNETAILPWLETGLEKLLPRNLVSHMIFAAARKR
ncbi:MAG: class I SAM-dependent methyltransferase [Candidatus Electrothrix gigas]